MTSTYCATCQQAPGHPEEVHTWFSAKKPGQDSQRPDSHPCGVHEPAGLQSTAETEALWLLM